ETHEVPHHKVFLLFLFLEQVSIYKKVVAACNFVAKILENSSQILQKHHLNYRTENKISSISILFYATHFFRLVVVVVSLKLSPLSRVLVDLRQYQLINFQVRNVARG